MRCGVRLSGTRSNEMAGTLGDMHLIRISPDRVVLKRGISEILVEGDCAGQHLETLVRLLASREHKLDDLTDQFPTAVRPALSNLLSVLEKRGFLSEEGNKGGVENGRLEIQNFYDSFRPNCNLTPGNSSQLKILIMGNNRISHSIAKSLTEYGCAEVTIGSHPILDSPFLSADDKETATYVDLEDDGDSLLAYSVLCSASECGEADALLDVNRSAMRAGRPHLPVWTSDLLGFLGPLHYPDEGPCFQCFRYRRDANEYRPDIARRVREFVVSERQAQMGTLPGPMLTILGGIAAVDILKLLTGISPADSLHAIVTLNLISFELSRHRLLKVPRCPECSDVAKLSHRSIVRNSPFAVTSGRSA